MKDSRKEEIIQALLKYLPPISKSINAIIINIQKVVTFNNSKTVAGSYKELETEIIELTLEVIPNVENLHKTVPLNDAKNSDDLILNKYHESISNTLSGLKELLDWIKTDDDVVERELEENDLLEAIDKMYQGAGSMMELVNMLTEEA